MKKIKQVFKVLMCALFGHRINVYLIEVSNKKECIRCGKKLTLWHIETIDDFNN